MANVLVIGYVWPEPNSSAAGKRILQILEYFTSNDYRVIFTTTAAPSEKMVNLEELGISSEKIELNNSSFNEFILDLKPEIVLFDRFMMEEQFGWRVSQYSPKSIKILDTEDLHFLRNFRGEKNIEKGSIKNSELAKREIASIYRCDLTLIISEEEMKLLSNEFNIQNNLLLYIPFLMEPTSDKKTLPTFEERKHFISIGNFKHRPNVDAVNNLKKEIWPLIRKMLPEAELHIYGAYPTQGILQLNNSKENFFVKGWAANAEEVVKNARVSLASIQFGAGLKGKLAEAMQCGTPNVTTSLGAEGMNGNLPWSGYIADTPKEFAKAAVALYNNKEVWLNFQEKGFTIIEERFKKETFQTIFKKRLKEIASNISAHRETNFIGSMLMHHSLKSTQHLSKYIQIKNELERLRSDISQQDFSKN